ncbi:MAG: NAD(P)-dependent alcohol dehydrogenase [Candidatus Firestonebacteria bacterium]|nr:NAD(P)-dependent alcohol dehydrogenase [Candidatus Firestonebacteria bacterium]
MKAAVLTKIRKFILEDREIPKLKPGFALVRIRAVGICGSDVHYFTHGRIGNQVVKKPLVLGHEASGLVVGIGKGVKNVKVGDKVALEPAIFCEKCEFCKSGRENLCKQVKFFGTPPVDGTYQEYVLHPSKMLFKLPKNMSFEQGALLEPLTIGMYAVQLAELKRTDTIAILGSGPIGLSILKSALYQGVKKIFVTDYLAYRLKIAAKHKNVVVVNAGANPVKKIVALTKGRGVDAVFEAAGAPEAFAQSILIARTGGRVIWVGIPDGDDITINNHEARRKELVIKTVRRTKHQNEKAIHAVGKGMIEVRDMATHRFRLEEIAKAFRVVENYKDSVVKAIIEM